MPHCFVASERTDPVAKDTFDRMIAFLNKKQIQLWIGDECMKKVLKIIGIAALVILILGIALVARLVITFLHDSKIQEQDQLLMVKSDEELLGEHIYIKRDGKGDVDVNYYFGDGESLPLVINLHGGAFIAGDADTLDTQSNRISKSWGVNVATVNYSLS